MTDHDKAGPLDAAIDDAVRLMVQVDPRPGLRYRVVGSITARPARTSGLAARLVWTAAFAAILIASVVLVRILQEPSRPAGPVQVVTMPPAAAPPPTAERPAAASPRTQPLSVPAVPKRRREPASESIFGPRTASVAAASVRPDDGAPVVGPARAVVAEPAHVPGSLGPIAPLNLRPIQVAPLAIEPLTVSPLSRRR